MAGEAKLLGVWWIALGILLVARPPWAWGRFWAERAPSALGSPPVRFTVAAVAIVAGVVALRLGGA